MKYVEDMTWDTDEEFIKSGVNNFINSTNTTLSQMRTLRSFPNGDKNCYNLPFVSRTKYLVRAGFYYGNYDNLLKPPTFVLEVDGKFNVTAYRLMPNRTALYLESRINYGANQSIPKHFSYYDDPYNWIWKPEEVPSYRSRTPAGGRYRRSWATVDNVPSWAVLDFAIEAHNASESIFLAILFREKSHTVSSYFVFYIALELFETTRKIAIYIDSQEKNVTEIPNGPSMVSIYPVNVTGGTANVTITSVD
ncbi:Malectin-like carbohydrate-binding domain containing protein [Parasponia andersonii]|uniref:Malectin-like carbohydrate-binding domain containing protein n=1 Tax=Parasponia andersonii TaxID=3476 RepID=A0A2P5D112_PARAD|nr:Malectin-like carbohydrate-binding domain containing protein [Parasponia andersonii]